MLRLHNFVQNYKKFSSFPSLASLNLKIFSKLQLYTDYITETIIGLYSRWIPDDFNTLL